MSVPYRVLCELRPALDGFAGIPQETRLLFSLFRSIGTIDTAGLINHGWHRLPRALEIDGEVARRLRKPDADEVARLSRVVITASRMPSTRQRERILWFLYSIFNTIRLVPGALLGSSRTIEHFDVPGFEDFLWNSHFSKTLDPDDFEKVTSSRFATLAPSWAQLDRAGRLLRGCYPRVDMRGFDAFLSQTPWPGTIASQTKLVVRYHDAIPIFLPHTIPNRANHQALHYRGLKLAVRNNAAFVCTSAAVREDLLRLYPEVEPRSHVIHDIVAGQYSAGRTEILDVVEIIRNRVEEKTRPAKADQTFYNAALKGDFRFLLTVATVEPRKNHARLLAAWEALRIRGHRDLKLVVVGTPGWDVIPTLTDLKRWYDRGEAFNLTGVPIAELRSLYASAAAVVCPSVAEGFDYPGVEAMLSGGVVAASDIPVHREVYGDAAVYFNPYATESCLAAVEQLLTADAGRLTDLRSAGRRVGAAYTADAVGPRWEAFFEDLRRERDQRGASGGGKDFLDRAEPGRSSPLEEKC